MSTNPEDHIPTELEKLRNLDKQYFDKFKVLFVCLCVKAQMLIEGINLPFFLVIVGPPSSLKTTILTIIAALPDCYKVDAFTSKAFVSHIANIKAEELNKIDLLPKIKGKTLITPELGPLFSAKEDKFQEIIGILTRILDGKGFRSESGARGSRGYDGDYYFTWLGATVSVPKRLWKMLSELGPKMYFLTIQVEQLTDEQKQQKILQNLEGKPFDEKLQEVIQQMLKFWSVLTSELDGKIVWESSKDDLQTKQRIASCAILLSKLRTYVSIERTQNGIKYEVSAPEDPSRATTSLLNLAKGSAVLRHRRYITDEDLEVVLAVALSSAYRDRVNLLRLLLENNGYLNTEIVIEMLKVSRQTALNMMKDLEVIGIVDRVQEDAVTKKFAAIKLREYFSWLLSDQYRKFLRES